MEQLSKRFLIEALKGAHAEACNALSNEDKEVEIKALVDEILFPRPLAVICTQPL